MADVVIAGCVVIDAVGEEEVLVSDVVVTELSGAELDVWARGGLASSLPQPASTNVITPRATS